MENNIAAGSAKLFAMKTWTSVFSKEMGLIFHAQKLLVIDSEKSVSKRIEARKVLFWKMPFGKKLCCDLLSTKFRSRMFALSRSEWKKVMRHFWSKNFFLCLKAARKVWLTIKQDPVDDDQPEPKYWRKRIWPPSKRRPNKTPNYRLIIQNTNWWWNMMVREW